MTYDDARLAVQAAGDPNAFADLYDRFYPRVYNYTRYRCDDDAAAEDIAAQVFERLLNVIQRYSPERGPFEAWLFAIARNAVNDYHRRERWRVRLPWELIQRRPADDPPLEETAIQTNLHECLAACLIRLSDRDRDLLGLKFSSGMTNRDIARLTGLSESNVGVILHRAVQQLRGWLGEAAGGDHNPSRMEAEVESFTKVV